MSREDRSERLHKRLEREAKRQRTEYIKELELEVSLRKEATCLDQRIIQELMRELDALKKLAWAVVEEEMSGVRVHPCDEHSEEIKARGMQPIYQALYEAIKMQADNKPLSIHFNADSVTIEGITYANDVFRQLGGIMPLNQTFRLVQRSTGINSGSVTIEYVDQEKK